MRIENIIELIREDVEKMDVRSAWKRGVNEYAFEILENMENNGYVPETKKQLIDEMLNGAHEDRKRNATLFDHWSVASCGGSYLCYDADIAERLCTPSELKKTRNGERKPNSREEWLDTQARALYQAGNRIIEAFENIMNTVEIESDSENIKKGA